MRSTSTSRQVRPACEDEDVQRVVGGALLVEGAQRVDEPLLGGDQVRDALGRGLDLEAVEERLALLGQGRGGRAAPR